MAGDVKTLFVGIPKGKAFLGGVPNLAHAQGLPIFCLKARFKNQVSFLQVSLGFRVNL